MVGGLAALTLLLLLGAGRVLPTWTLFLGTIAFAKGLVALGQVTLMRGGLASFGQGLFYCAGAYAAGLFARSTGIGDALTLTLVGSLLALALGLLVGPLVASYRGIFFATLTLALSMIAYGALNKIYFLGGSDGINLRAPSFLGHDPQGAEQTYMLFAFAAAAAVVGGAFCRLYFGSMRGLLSLAIRDNELRVEYLGASVRNAALINFAIAAALGGMGGAIAAMALGHIEPEYAFWTTSGEFVFLAILSGHASVVAVFLASVMLELVRSFSSQYFPNTWQLALGIFLLLVILFLPQGLGSLLRRRRPAAASEPGA